MSGPALIPGDIAVELSGVLDELLRDHAGGVPTDDFFAAPHDRLWERLVAGGWPLLGASEESDGAGLDLLGLSTVVQVWGRYLVPLPFVPTLLLRRWGAAAPAEEPLTYAVGGVAPYGGRPGVRVVTTPAGDSGPVDSAVEGGDVDRFAPSLPLASVPGGSELPEAAPGEIRVLAAAEALGAARALLDATVAYTRQRVQFGRPVAEFQAVRHTLANMRRDVEMAQTAVVWAANAPAATAPARLAWTWSRAVGENAIQLHGGYGFTWEAGLHYTVRHIAALGTLLTLTGVRL